MTDDREIFNAYLASAADGLSVRLEKCHFARMWHHFSLVTAANRSFNLTRIISPADAAVKHYADSLTLLASPWVNRDTSLSVLDVGTGAGFPAVPLAIVCEQWRITAIDGTGKKARFVSDAAESLGLVNLSVRHARAADLARGGGAAFDLIVMRAVSRLDGGIEEVHSLADSKGAVVFYKSGALPAEERAAGETHARRRGFPVIGMHTLELRHPGGDLERWLIRYARTSASP